VLNPQILIHIQLTNATRKYYEKRESKDQTNMSVFEQPFADRMR